MRQGPIDGAGPSAPVYRAAVESAEDARITIDFPATPDDVRLRSQTMSRLSQAGCVTGLTGLAVTILGMVGLAGGAYLCLDAAAEVDDTETAEHNRWVGFGLGGGMGTLSALAVTFGLGQVCLCLKARREAEQEMGTISTRVHFTAPRQGVLHERRQERRDESRYERR
ncbi:hypothetical protein [Pandoraea vervacti]|uniref:hypothetical protein n=1 Tax=Pandoraea vervacti TaxID=656178 RepID=UPI000ACFE632|nr:hypothetical protein [Pandoraea vervacti]